MRRNIKLLLFTLSILWASNAHAFFFVPIPIIDVGRAMEQTQIFIDNIFKYVLEKFDTVKKLEQLASLTKMASNANATLRSFGQANAAIKHLMKTGKTRFINSWTDGSMWNLQNAGNMLSRWGVKPTETGPLASIDQYLFGRDSIGEGIIDSSNAVTEFTYKLQHNYTRDRFLRRLFKDAQNDRKTIGGRVFVWDKEDEMYHVEVSPDPDAVVTSQSYEDRALLSLADVDTNMTETAIQSAFIRKDMNLEMEMARMHQEVRSEGKEYTITEGLYDTMLQKSQSIRMLNRQFELTTLETMQEQKADAAELELLQNKYQYRVDKSIVGKVMSDD